MTTGEGLLTAGSRQRVVLDLAGDLDVAAACEAHKRLIVRDLPPGGELVLDLSRLTFMDSTGIRLILQAHAYALQHDAALVVVRGPEQVMRVLELVGLDEQLDLVDEA